MNKAAKIIFSIMLAFILGVGCFVGGIKVTQHKEAQIQETVSEDAQDFGYRDGYDTASEEKAAEIADLNQDIANLEEMLAELQTQLENVKTEEEYNALVAQITALNTQISTLQAQLAAAQEELAEYETLKEQRKYGLFTDDGKLIMSLYDMEQAGILAHSAGVISRGTNFDSDLIYGHLVLPTTGTGRGHCYIANDTFKNTTKLKSVTGDFFDIGENAFENSSIEKITVSEQWGAQTQIGREAFKNCKNLSTVYLGSTIRIEDYAFYGCENLTKVTGGLLNDSDTVASEFGIASNQIRYVGNYAFAYSGITYAVINSLQDNSSNYYGTHIYEGCTNMTYANVSFCGEYQFKDCTSLETLYLHNSSYPENALQGCTSLQNIYTD